MPATGETSWLTGRDVAVIGDFLARPGVVATDISGIASASPLGNRRRKCLFIDNESLSAQFAWLDLDTATLEPGAIVPLLPANRDDLRAVGRAPDNNDPGPGEYILDGEGVAWLDPHYYVAGSHSIHDWVTPDGKKRADYRRSAHLVARVGREGTKPELTYRLNEVLGSKKAFAPYFLKSPNKRDGINIEAIAAFGRRLYFGFRSPVIDGNALILSVRASALFTSGADLAAKTIRVPLGRGIGIRDLAALPDGRFLVLAGPAPDAYAGFTLNLFDPKRETVGHLGTLAPTRKDKVEGLLLATYAPAPDGSAKATILILNDHPENGRPRLYDLAIPPG